MLNTSNESPLFIRIIEKATIGISGAVIMAMMLYITADVILRNVFSITVPGAYEITEQYLMPLAIFPILLFLYNSNILPRLDFLIIKFNKKTQYFINLLFLLMEIFVFIMITVYGWNKAIAVTQEGLAFNASGSMYPLFPLYYLVPIGFGLLTIGSIYKFFFAMKNIKSMNKVLEDW